MHFLSQALSQPGRTRRDAIELDTNQERALGVVLRIVCWDASFHSSAGRLNLTLARTQLAVPLDPTGSWEEVAQSQGYSYQAFIYAWMSRRTEAQMRVDLGPLKGMPTLQQLSELDPITADKLQIEYRDKLVTKLPSLACCGVRRSIWCASRSQIPVG